jgi:hypothetical protein
LQLMHNSFPNVKCLTKTPSHRRSH